MKKLGIIAILAILSVKPKSTNILWGTWLNILWGTSIDDLL